MPTRDEWERYNKIAAKRRRFLKQAEERGYRFSDKFYELTNKANIIDPSAAADILEGYTPVSIYNDPSTVYMVDPATGEVVSGSEGRKIERAYATLKGLRTKRERSIPQWSESVLSATYSNLDTLGSITWRNSGGRMNSAAAIVRSVIDRIREQYGDQVAARAIVNMERKGHPINFELLYEMNTPEANKYLMEAFSREIAPYVKLSADDIYGSLEMI